MLANSYPFLRCFLLAVLICQPGLACAELVVIVNADRNVERISREEVVNIFMGRYRKLADGNAALPLEVKGNAPERRYFYGILLNKSLAEINAYWARLVFSGKTSPPVSVVSGGEVLEGVAGDPAMIGYLDSSLLDGRVKVVYALPEAGLP
ncbi:MAG: substrate-binding domain-containing protein [Methylococcaceae bacterium]|nr:substrate-binding domain-containing protein [Methylococcaceae bacterium]